MTYFIIIFSLLKKTVDIISSKSNNNYKNIINI
uniref:Uncharacterized protein n=1 Tax=viral metagenome TaxID=1070528 RepID=A0A6C0DA45_9ZZZZ